MQPLTGPYVYSVNRWSEIVLPSVRFTFSREEGVAEADIKV